MASESLPEQLHAAIERVGELIEAVRADGDTPDLRQLQDYADQLAIYFHFHFVRCTLEEIRR